LSRRQLKRRKSDLFLGRVVSFKGRDRRRFIQAGQAKKGDLSWRGTGTLHGGKVTICVTRREKKKKFLNIKNPFLRGERRRGKKIPPQAPGLVGRLFKERENYVPTSRRGGGKGGANSLLLQAGTGGKKKGLHLFAEKPLQRRGEKTK